MVNEIRVNATKLEFEDDDLATFKTLKELAEVSLAGTETLTNKTLTSPLFTGTIGGWIAAGETWTYVSIDVKTGKINVNADVTGKYSPGMRIKYTQNATVKYGIITVVGAYAAGVTPITFWGGIDYTLADAVISSNFYSVVKAPFGFPISPTKWMVTLYDTTNRSQATPTQNVWYNLGGMSINIPIGSWRVVYCVLLQNSVAVKTTYVTLSTADNSESNSNTTVGMLSQAANDPKPATKEVYLLLTSKTPYYLNAKSADASSGTILFVNSITPLYILVVCAYL